MEVEDDDGEEIDDDDDVVLLEKVAAGQDVDAPPADEYLEDSRARCLLLIHVGSIPIVLLFAISCYFQLCLIPLLQFLVHF
jgi:hypothetical protein